MNLATSDDPRLDMLKTKHGLNHEQALRLLEKLQASLAFDIVDGDTGEPLVDFDDDLSDLVDRAEDAPQFAERKSIHAD
jgi:hypothetical protein